MKNASLFKQSCQIATLKKTALTALAALSFCAQPTHAAQEDPAQDPAAHDAQDAPLMLPIRHRRGPFCARQAPNPNFLPSEYYYGCDGQFKFVKQPDNTYRHFSYVSKIGEWMQTEPTAYRHEISFNPETRTAYRDFVSIEQGRAEPAREGEKLLYGEKHMYVVQLLPQTYFRDSYKYEKQADDTYKQFVWSKKDEEWVEEENTICREYRLCKKDGTVLRTSFSWERPATKADSDKADSDQENLKDSLDQDALEDESKN